MRGRTVNFSDNYSPLSASFDRRNPTLSRRSRASAIGQVESADGPLVLRASHDANVATGQTYGARMIYIRSSNVIESSFATVCHRTDRTKGCLTRDGMLAMIYKLGLCAERSWRRLRGFEWLAKIVDGVKFHDGVEVQNVVRSH